MIRTKNIEEFTCCIYSAVTCQAVVKRQQFAFLYFLSLNPLCFHPIETRPAEGVILSRSSFLNEFLSFPRRILVSLLPIFFFLQGECWDLQVWSRVHWFLKSTRRHSCLDRENISKAISFSYVLRHFSAKIVFCFKTIEKWLFWEVTFFSLNTSYRVHKD